MNNDTQYTTFFDETAFAAQPSGWTRVIETATSGINYNWLVVNDSAIDKPSLIKNVNTLRSRIAKNTSTNLGLLRFGFRRDGLLDSLEHRASAFFECDTAAGKDARAGLFFRGSGTDVNTRYETVLTWDGSKASISVDRFVAGSGAFIGEFETEIDPGSPLFLYTECTGQNPVEIRVIAARSRHDLPFFVGRVEDASAERITTAGSCGIIAAFAFGTSMGGLNAYFDHVSFGVEGAYPLIMPKLDAGAYYPQWWADQAVAALPTLSVPTAINITSSGFQPRVTATY